MYLGLGMPLSYWLKPWFQSPAPHEPGVTVPACSPSHWEAEAQAGDSEVQGQVEYLRLSQEKVPKELNLELTRRHPSLCLDGLTFLFMKWDNTVYYKAILKELNMISTKARHIVGVQ